jgi:16S rRNA processing protein RimM
MDINLEEWSWTIGLITSPFGRIGELKVRPETDIPHRFQSLQKVVLRLDHGIAGQFEVERAREHKGHVLLKLRQIDSISEAENWRNAKVQVVREQAPELPEDSYYSSDLIGMDVYTVQERYLGKLEKVLPYPAQDLFKIGEILIPAVKEFIRKVDMNSGKIVVDPPKGLLPGEDELENENRCGDASARDDRAGAQPQHNQASASPQEGSHPSGQSEGLHTGSSSNHRRYSMRRRRRNDHEGGTNGGRNKRPGAA